jgi:enoyl-CoA hydratase
LWFEATWAPVGEATVAAIEVEAMSESVHLLTLNRPERLNAINFDLVGELHLALDEIAANDRCKVAIMTGAGRGFCSGLDLADWGTLPEAGGHRYFPAGQTGQNYLASLTEHLRATPQIVLAAVNGPAFGGGLALALACDLRLASVSARFSSVFIKTGLTGTDVGVTYLLPKLIGAARAFDMIVTGRTIDSAEAAQMGLVSRVLPDEELFSSALALAGEISQYTTFGLRNTKEVMWHNLDATNMAAAIALENRNQDLGGHSEEVRDYMRKYAASRVKR